MEGKKLLFGAEARNEILCGVNQICDAVASTLGPRGRNVIIDNEFASPYPTKDGVSVAKQVQLVDPIQNAGARLVAQAAERTVSQAGDGTTTATILTAALYREGIKHLTAGVDGMAIKRGIDKGLKLILEALGARAIPVETEEDIKAVALISANGDDQIASLISEGMAKVGDDGVVLVQGSNTSETFLEVTDGLTIEEGYITPLFVNEEGTKKCSLEDTYVFMTDRKLTSAADVVNLMKFANKDNKALTILAEHVEGEALAMLIINSQRGTLRSCAVRAPGYGGVMKDTLDDISALIGGRVVSESSSMSVSDINESNYKDYFGVANKVIVTDKGSTFVNEGSKEAIAKRIAFIKLLIEEATADDLKDNLRKRVAKLAGGIAMLKVGALTPAELREKIDRVDDALHATRAAKEEGYVPGAGSILKYIKDDVSLKAIEGSVDEQIGFKILLKALDSPLRQLCENSGMEAGEALVVTEEVCLPNKEGVQYMGMDFRNLGRVDLLESGIIDPVLVTKSALSNACSIAGVLLTSDCIVSEIRKAKPNTSAIPNGMMGAM